MLQILRTGSTESCLVVYVIHFIVDSGLLFTLTTIGTFWTLYGADDHYWFVIWNGIVRHQ